jgi:extradiol dioxygenase family protein
MLKNDLHFTGNVLESNQLIIVFPFGNFIELLKSWREAR